MYLYLVKCPALKSIHVIVRWFGKPRSISKAENVLKIKVRGWIIKEDNNPRCVDFHTCSYKYYPVSGFQKLL